MLEGLKPFLARSAAVHGALLCGAFAGGLRLPSRPKEEVYRIDFIGPTAGILNREKEAGGAGPAPAAAPEPPAKPPPQTDPDAFSLRRRVSRLLPRPTFLGSSLPKPSALSKSERPVASSAPGPASTGNAGASAPNGSGGGSASVAADMPDFPFPWYLSRLRAALWERWSARSVQGTGLCAVSFSILRDGLMTDLRVASTSGDESFDYAALSAVQAAAPFAPLPDGFADSFLKVRVEFKS